MSDSEKKHGLIEEVFETALFNCRFLVLLAVLGSLPAAIMMFVKGTLELIGSEQEFDGRPVLWAFRRFYSIFDLCCSRFRGGGVQSRSSDGNRDIDAVVSDSF